LFVYTLYNDEISRKLESRFTKLDHWFEVEEERDGNQSEEWLDYRKSYQNYLDNSFNIDALHKKVKFSLSKI
jgi:hypothetical protein